MSNPTTQSSSVADSAPAAQPVRRSQPPKKNTNKAKEAARSMFNASAPSISAEKFFTDFVEKKRNNVEIVFDGSVVGRIAEPYVTKSRTHAQNKLNQPRDGEGSDDLQCSTHALISLAVIRKMMMTIPASEEYELGRFSDIVKTDLFAPKSAIAAIDNIGKFEYEDKVARIKYNSQDIFRQMMFMCQLMNNHSDFNAMYSSPVTVDGITIPWDEVDVTKLVITSESSVRWLRDEAANFLNQAYKTTWDASVTTDSGPYVMKVSYPRLEIVADREKQVKNVVAWMALLHPKMPAVAQVVAAGLATCWDLLWFQRLGHKFENIIKGLPKGLVNRPFDVLTVLGLYHCDISTDDYDGTSYVGFVKEIHRRNNGMVADFSEMFELARQPDNKFGSAAQLLPYRPQDLRASTFIGLDSVDLFKLRSDAQSICVTKIKDKGLVSAGLIFGFSKSVSVIENYIGRVNGDPNSIRSSFLNADIKKYN